MLWIEICYVLANVGEGTARLDMSARSSQHIESAFFYSSNVKGVGSKEPARKGVSQPALKPFSVVVLADPSRCFSETYI